MKVFFDTEFLDDGPRQPLRLISIGLAAEDGRTYYAENADFKERWLEDATSGPWLEDNVLPHLTGPKKPHHVIARDVEKFALHGGTFPEFWGYFPAYDWVLLSQLYGRMLDVPRGFPQRPNCVAQWADSRGVSLVMSHKGPLHHALNDALWTRDAYNMVLESGP